MECRTYIEKQEGIDDTKKDAMIESQRTSAAAALARGGLAHGTSNDDHLHSPTSS